MSTRLFPVGSLCLCQISLPDGGKVSIQVRVLGHREGGLVYVHYVGNDARLDEWVVSSRLSRIVGGDDHHHHDHHHQAASLESNRKRKHSVVSTHAGSDTEDEGTRKIHHHGAGQHHEHTKVRNIQRIVFGEHLVDAWYYSPYPPPYDKFIDKLYICDVTLKYMRSPKVYARHRAAIETWKEDALQPPGEQIYRDDNVSVFQIEGAKQRLYCQNLCLLGKLFIEHKTLHYDPSPFFFFVVCERSVDSLNRQRYHPVGYFSKEKDSPDGYNLACILTFPPYQRKGYGKFIISLSYELSRREEKVGSPEKPLSDLGKLSYRAFWSCRLLTVLKEACAEGSRPGVKDLAQATGIRVEDTVSTLQALGMIKHLRGSLVMAVSAEHVNQLLEPFVQKGFTQSFCRPECFLN